MINNDKRIVVIAGIPIYKEYIKNVEGETNKYEWLAELKITMKSGYIWKFGLCSELWGYVVSELWEFINKLGMRDNE